MPVYEFYCPKCNSKFELRRSISDAAEAASCPKCKGAGRRIFSPFVAFNKFADVSEGQSPIAGAGGGCSSCSTGGGSGCSGCH